MIDNIHNLTTAGANISVGAKKEVIEKILKDIKSKYQIIDLTNRKNER